MFRARDTNRNTTHVIMRTYSDRTKQPLTLHTEHTDNAVHVQCTPWPVLAPAPTPAPTPATHAWRASTPACAHPTPQHHRPRRTRLGRQGKHTAINCGGRVGPDPNPLLLTLPGSLAAWSTPTVSPLDLCQTIGHMPMLVQAGPHPAAGGPRGGQTWGELQHAAAPLPHGPRSQATTTTARSCVNAHTCLSAAAHGVWLNKYSDGAVAHQLRCGRHWSADRWEEHCGVGQRAGWIMRDTLPRPHP